MSGFSQAVDFSSLAIFVKRHFINENTVEVLCIVTYLISKSDMCQNAFFLGWRRSSQTRGRGARGFGMRRPRRDRYFRDHYGPPHHMHPEDFQNFSSTPYHDSYYGSSISRHDDFQKARSAPWIPHHAPPSSGPSFRSGNYHHGSNSSR